MASNIHTIYRRIFRVWRKKRYELFLETMRPDANYTCLDIGGSVYFWAQYSPPFRTIHTLNVRRSSTPVQEMPNYQIRTFIGDGCALPFPDQSYDIAFSNSVIEHVGSWERQKQFAADMRRVGKAVWCQTPAYECPIEPHYLAPFVHWLPESVQNRVIRWSTLWGIIQKPHKEKIHETVATTRLLRKCEMVQLFPDCEILTERLFGIVPKSYIAVRTNMIAPSVHG